jgi:deoxyxylulose-5-phosphate synthase
MHLFIILPLLSMTLINTSYAQSLSEDTHVFSSQYKNKLMKMNNYCQSLRNPSEKSKCLGEMRLEYSKMVKGNQLRQSQRVMKRIREYQQNVR